MESFALQRAEDAQVEARMDRTVLDLRVGEVDDVIRIAHEREAVEEVIKAQLEIEKCSPCKYYPFNDLTWQLFEEKTGKKRTG